MKELGYGKNYKYSHAYSEHFVSQEFLPEEIQNTNLYQPADNINEQKAKQLMIKRWKNKYK